MNCPKSSPLRSCELDPWEIAYTRFETPSQEIRKFTRRLVKVGATNWHRAAEILELFCGRGNGLHALTRLGFTRVKGADWSASLVSKYAGPAQLYVCDCRDLPFGSASMDIVIVQGGLHHLKKLPDDLAQTLSETARVLRNDGLFVVIEPWQTPFLAFVHWICCSPISRRMVPKLDVLATMIEHERQTYDQWLGQPHMITRLFDQFFSKHSCSAKWGKYTYIGRKRNLRP